MNKKAKICIFTLLIGSMLALSACADTRSQTELTISAAASLTDSLTELQSVYESNHKNVKLFFNFGASGTLQQQIERGAPTDLFISAGKKQMQALADKQLVDPASQRNLLTNDLVLIVPHDATLAVENIRDLSDASIKLIAIGQPESVPVGGYTKETLTFYDMWAALQPKFVFAKDVRQVLTYVETGNADAGFVYNTDGMTSGKVKVALTIDQASYTKIEYPIGLIKASKHSKEAEEFYSFLQSEQARDVFVKYGFSLPQP